MDIGYGDHEILVNSDVLRFSASLHAWLEYGKWIESGVRSEELTQEYIDGLEEDLKSIDPAAFGSRAHFWPQILDQTRQGLL